MKKRQIRCGKKENIEGKEERKEYKDRRVRRGYMDRQKEEMKYKVKIYDIKYEMRKKENRDRRVRKVKLKGRNKNSSKERKY